MENQWFTFTKSERRSIFILLFLLVFITILPRFFTFFIIKQQKETVEWEVQYAKVKNQIDSLTKIDSIEKASFDKKPYKKNYSPKPQNTRSAKSEAKPEYKSTPQPKKHTSPTPKAKASPPPKPIVLDINTATATDFAQLYGIGEVLSKRIVKFRESLGGFYSIEQVGQTFGIENEVYAQIKGSLTVDNSYELKKLNLNTASFEALDNHPFISEKLAQQIINFREKVKPYESQEDVMKLYLMNEELYQKLKPYIVW